MLYSELKDIAETIRHLYWDTSTKYYGASCKIAEKLTDLLVTAVIEKYPKQKLTRKDVINHFKIDKLKDCFTKHPPFPLPPPCRLIYYKYIFFGYTEEESISKI